MIAGLLTVPMLARRWTIPERDVLALGTMKDGLRFVAVIPDKAKALVVPIRSEKPEVGEGRFKPIRKCTLFRDLVLVTEKDIAQLLATGSARLSMVVPGEGTHDKEMLSLMLEWAIKIECVLPDPPIELTPETVFVTESAALAFETSATGRAALAQPPKEIRLFIASEHDHTSQPASDQSGSNTVEPFLSDRQLRAKTVIEAAASLDIDLSKQGRKGGRQAILDKCRELSPKLFHPGVDTDSELFRKAMAEAKKAYSAVSDSSTIS